MPFQAVTDGAVAYAAAVLNAHPEPLVILVDGSRVRVANNAFLDLFGLRPEQARMRSVDELGLRAADDADIDAALGEVLATGTPMVDRWTELGRPGQRPVELFASARRIELVDYEHAGILLRLARRSDRQLRGKAHRHNLALLQSISASTSDVILTLSEDGVIETASTAIAAMFGYSPSEVVGLDLSRLISQVGSGNSVSRIKRALKDSDSREAMPSPAEFVGVRKDGSRIPVDVSIGEIDREQRFTAVIRDVSERKRLEQQVLDISTDEQRRIGLELHDDTLQAFTGMQLIAEELIDLLEPGSRANELARMLADNGAAASRRARLLARGLIPARIPAGGLVTALETLASDIGELHGMAISVEHDETAVKLPDGEVATHIYRIVQEAASNAARHSGADVAKISVTQASGSLIVRVADGGDGFDEDRVALRQGLGLKIMSYRADLIGAELSIENWRAGGTVVVLSVPYYRWDVNAAGLRAMRQPDA